MFILNYHISTKKNKYFIYKKFVTFLMQIYLVHTGFLEMLFLDLFTFLSFIFMSFESSASQLNKVFIHNCCTF